jgi:hypothetical protein
MKNPILIILVLLLGACSAKFNEQKETKEINTFLDKWHQSAAKADTITFFNSMGGKAIYIGTDPAERWTKDEFYKYAMPYFRQGKGWDFKKIERQIHFSRDAQVAWFNETLNTWMGVCRGSGVLQKGEKGWRIMQYHLSVTVPNEKTDDFIDLMKADTLQK